MGMDQIKKNAASCRATLVGQRLAEMVDDGDFFAKMESPCSAAERQASESLCQDLESLDMTDTASVAEFLDSHFSDHLEELDAEQREEAAKAFAAWFG